MWNWLKGLPPMSKAALAAGIAATAAGAAMSVAYGSTLAASDKGQIIYTGVSFVCAVAGVVVFGLMAGKLWREKRWAAAIFPTLILVLATGWNILSITGFNATERLSAAAHREEILALSRDEAAMRKAYAQKLMGVATIRGASRAERREFIASASSEIGKVASPTAASIKILPDALAEMLSQYSGRPVRDIQFTIMFYMAVLLVLIESSGFAFTTYFDDREASVASIPKDDASGGGRKRFKVVGDADDAGDAARKSPAKPAMQAASAEYTTTQRRVPSVSFSGAQRSVPPPTDIYEYLREHASGVRSKIPQRAMAQETGVSQSTISRKSRQVQRHEERAARKVVRDAGNQIGGFGGYAGGMHAPGIA